MYRYVPYSEIDKNKWNGTVHYATNGNIFGHYWYLKAVYKEWDGIVEDDYQSVLPVLPSANNSVYKFTPELGPYSVKQLNKDRTSTMVELMKKYTSGHYFPIHSAVDLDYINFLSSNTLPSQKLNLIDSYEAITDGYTSEVHTAFEKVKKEAVTFVSSVKPEIIVAQANLTNESKNIYLRIMYNAMHRGIGWSQGITDKKTGKYLALSFFVVSHNVIHEILYLKHQPMEYRWLLYDMALKNSAGKPTLFMTYHDDDAALAIGFKKTKSALIQFSEERKKSWWDQFRNK